MLPPDSAIVGEVKRCHAAKAPDTADMVILYVSWAIAARRLPIQNRFLSSTVSVLAALMEVPMRLFNRGISQIAVCQDWSTYHELKSKQPSAISVPPISRYPNLPCIGIAYRSHVS